MAYIIALLIILAYPFHLPPVHSGAPWWTIVSAGFAHVSIYHVALNVISLLSIWLIAGKLMRWTLLYFAVSMIAGNAAQWVLSDIPAMGCSAGLFGLLGALTRIAPPELRVRIFPLPWRMSMRVLSLLMIMLTLVASKHVGLIPHLVGFLAGWFIAVENINGNQTAS